MAQLTTPEKNALRKVVRLLDMRDNKGDPTYDATCQEIAAQVRDMLQPTEKFNIILPEDCPFEVKVVWYETDSQGIKHLFTQVNPVAKKKARKGETTPVAEGG